MDASASCNCAWFGAFFCIIVLIMLFLFLFDRVMKIWYPEFSLKIYFKKYEKKFEHGAFIQISQLKLLAGKEEEIESTCGFVNAGAANMGVFVSAVIVGFIITITMTRFTVEHDFVFAFFDAENPCIVFDHWPAKLWAMMFISFMGVTSTSWAGMLWLWIYGKKHLQTLLFATLVCDICIDALCASLYTYVQIYLLLKSDILV